MRVSVIIPAYNVEAYIAETIESVLQQTQSVSVSEVIVVDDGSTDRTAEVAESVGKTVQVYRQDNAGASAARNFALDRASGDLIAFLDADDLWEPRKLELQIAYLKAHPEVGTVASSFSVFGTGVRSRIVEMVDTRLLNFEAIDFLVSPRVHPSTLLCHSKIAHSVRFPVGVPDGEDVIYATLLRTKARMGAVEEMLMKRREHPGQATKTPEHFKRGVMARITWAKANHKLLDVDSLDDAATAVLHAAVGDVMAGYWMRDLKLFKKMRRQLLDIWPKGKEVPKELRRLTPWLLLLRLRDLFNFR
jgi:glycosyltransferase involved in cell wall biosynthesis